MIRRCVFFVLSHIMYVAEHLSLSLSLSLSLFDVSVILHFFTICTWPVLCCSMAVGKRQGGVEV